MKIITTYSEWLEIADDGDKKAIKLIDEVHNAAFEGEAYEGDITETEEDIAGLEDALVAKYSERGYGMALSKC